VIVRSSANVAAGARTRLSAILHGGLLVLAVFALAPLLNRIPLAALAAILLYTGFKLAHPKLFVAAWKSGHRQFVAFVVTVVAILLTDLLVGIAIGLVVGVFFIIIEHLRAPALVDRSLPGSVVRRYALPEQVTFLSKAGIAETLDALPAGSRVEIDGRQTRYLDHDVLELITDFAQTAGLRGIDYRLVGLPAVATVPSHKH
jgi:SulP family sulfate permease